MDANNASELIALRILAQRAFALLASTQPDPDAFIMSQLEKAKIDADRYNITIDKPSDAQLIRNETKSILTNLFHGMLQSKPR